MSRMFDHISFAQAFKSPKQNWFSYGIVASETEQAPSAQLKSLDDSALPYGPMVSVVLQPSGVAVNCRVSSQVAGDGEADYYPFVAGDEVLVALPEGHERAGATIIGRMNQSLDAWPSVVAGQDATKNTMGFRRMRAPYVLETASSYLIRSALTGSQIGIDAQGQLIMNDGDQGTMVIGAEAIGFASGDGTAFMHVLPPTKEVFLGADTATLLLSASESKFISQGKISFATAGGVANQTGVTAEQVVAFVIDVITALASAGAFNPAMLPTPIGPPANPAVIGAIVSAALAALQTPVPAAAVPGGIFAAYPTIFGPTGLLATTLGTNPLAGADVSGFVPGFGKPGFRL